MLCSVPRPVLSYSTLKQSREAVTIFIFQMSKLRYRELKEFRFKATPTLPRLASSWCPVPTALMGETGTNRQMF